MKQGGLKHTFLRAVQFGATATLVVGAAMMGLGFWSGAQPQNVLVLSAAFAVGAGIAGGLLGTAVGATQSIRQAKQEAPEPK